MHFICSQWHHATRLTGHGIFSGMYTPFGVGMLCAVGHCYAVAFGSGTHLIQVLVVRPTLAPRSWGALRALVMEQPTREAATTRLRPLLP